MRVFIGGAYNGKRAYVKALLEKEGKTSVRWVQMTDRVDPGDEIVLDKLEQWLQHCSLSEAEAIDRVMQVLKKHRAIVILTDIGRGIVPIDGEQRALRDRCGRLYQRIIAEADEVTQIWYGIPKIVKRRGEVL